MKQIAVSDETYALAEAHAAVVKRKQDLEKEAAEAWAFIRDALADLEGQEAVKAAVALEVLATRDAFAAALVGDFLNPPSA